MKSFSAPLSTLARDEKQRVYLGASPSQAVRASDQGSFLRLTWKQMLATPEADQYFENPAGQGCRGGGGVVSRGG